MLYLKLFNTHSEYEQYEHDNMIVPNVSYCLNNEELHYNPINQQALPLVVTYNVEDASEPTRLYYYYIAQEEGEPTILGVDMFEKVEIDGTEVSVADIDTDEGTYQLSVGEHTVAYTLKDPTFIGMEVDEQTGMPTKIGAMFVGCTAITNVQIPNTVTSIGSSAFFACEGLTSVTIPNSVTSIGQDAFRFCSSLTSVTIGSGVTTIGDFAFCRCSSLDSASTAAIEAINSNATMCKGVDAK